METKINGKNYKVNITKKRNKNIYFRVKEDLEIYVTCPYLTSEAKIKRLLNENEEVINTITKDIVVDYCKKQKEEY